CVRMDITTAVADYAMDYW
nr:immunoglobulin heavy chain junction region [Mus musculus]